MNVLNMTGSGCGNPIILGAFRPPVAEPPFLNYKAATVSYGRFTGEWI